MLKAISYGTKRNSLLIVTGLVVAYVRNVLQYGRYSWDSLTDFLVFWLLHYFAVGLVAAISYACIKGTERFFFGYEEGSKGISADEAIVYIALVILVSAVCIFFISLLPLNNGYEDYW